MGMITDPVLARRVDRIRRASTTGVLGLAVGGFSMSYGSLHGLALAEGVPASLAWVWPLIVDGFIVVASLSVLHAVLERRSSAYPWCLMLGFSANSVGFNVLHAAPTPVARLIGAVHHSDSSHDTSIRYSNRVHEANAVVGDQHQLRRQLVGG